MRRRQVHEALRALCAELRMHYTGCSEAPPFRESARYRGPDRMHLNAEGHRWVGEEESRALLAAWRRLHGADEPLYLESEALT
jgi:lysophospholipase L1-like esterase